MNTLKKWACGGSIACFLAAGLRLGAQTNDLYAIQFPPETPRRLWPIFGSEFVSRSQPELIDRFGFPAHLGIIREQDVLGSRVFADLGRQARSSLNHVLQQSAREAALKRFSGQISAIKEWREDHIPIPFVEGWIEGSIGNVEEEDIQPVSASYSAAHWHWLKTTYDDGSPKYGLRPNIDPYVYFSPVWDIRKGYRIAGDFRWYYDWRDGHNRLTATTTFPFGHYRLTAGFSGDPLDPSSINKNPTSASLQLARNIGHRLLVDVWSFGVSDSFNGHGPAFSLSFDRFR